jgi:hypothetical protein
LQFDTINRFECEQLPQGQNKTKATVSPTVTQRKAVVAVVAAAAAAAAAAALCLS